MDYLDWRGDIVFAYAPFNEVDNLILSQLVYVNLDHIVPSRWTEGSITIREAAERYFALYSEEERSRLGYITRISLPLLHKLADCPRFATARLSHFERTIDLDRVKQFAAMRIALDDGSVFYAYRGTDNTIVGWKENFQMCITTPVPAQYEALRYLEDTAEGDDAPLRLGGHSKGGNLAVYAAARCRSELRRRIIAVYNNDGPGFDASMMRSEGYRELLDRIVTIVPQSSVVGLLLEHAEAYIVVQSKASLLMQHEAFTWEVKGSSFVRGDAVEKNSQLLDTTLKSWLAQLGKEQRQQFIAAVFHALDVGEVRTLEDLGRAKWSSINGMIRAMNQTPEYKTVLARTLRLLLREGHRVMLAAAREARLRTSPTAIPSTLLESVTQQAQGMAAEERS